MAEAVSSGVTDGEAALTTSGDSDVPYSTGFFETLVAGSTPSAVPVLRFLRELYAPESIVDIGCGSGAWLSVAASLGFTTLRGYDGPWVDPAAYTSAAIDFVPLDLETSSPEHPRRYDLAMSVEVAEHLSEPRADVIVDALVAASDVVLFGAALRKQGGTHHVNEQPQSYWVEKFRARGYEPYDVIRPVIWDDPDVEVWFKQNTLLYVKTGAPALDAAGLRALERPIWDIVHPDHYERKIAKVWAAATERRGARDADQLRRLQERNAELEEKLAANRAKKQELRQDLRRARDEARDLRRRLAAAQARANPVRALARKVARRLR